MIYFYNIVFGLVRRTRVYSLLCLYANRYYPVSIHPLFVLLFLCRHCIGRYNKVARLASNGHKTESRGKSSSEFQNIFICTTHTHAHTSTRCCIIVAVTVPCVINENDGYEQHGRGVWITFPTDFANETFTNSTLILKYHVLNTMKTFVSSGVSRGVVGGYNPLPPKSLKLKKNILITQNIYIVLVHFILIIKLITYKYSVV